ncbi:helix-turn-helix domain-containing protein [Paenibacillus sp. CF384]|uniref:response regulator transcription factor n=1 Tax=Paenibacillus sp. CF384 TaxID=1884382 RepID=UPI000895CAC6|nr:helix-turn-helix domain-containing protein [Paenibacillus sp. CF384]SDX07206.1 two-component system, response regulator YesN [Paenibacillus sp. CF384]
MYKLLIVDDEVYAIKALLRGIDWKGLGYSEVYSASDADEAMEIIRSVSIDVLLCDIEMPDSNGLDLVGWVREHSTSIVPVFLTGHADFAYAQQAIRLGSYEYLLKPVNYDQLRTVMVKVQERVEDLRKVEQFDERFQTYEKLWEKQKPLLTERFWQDILAQRLIPTADNLMEQLPAYHVTFDPKTWILPILLSVEMWSKEFNLRDEEIMEYALRNAAAEMFLQSHAGDVIQDRNGLHFILIYLTNPAEADKDEWHAKCQDYIDVCSRLFYCSLSCYIGRPTEIIDLSESYHALLELEARNIANTRVVQFQQESTGSVSTKPIKAPVHIECADWVVLFELGKKEELMKRLEAILAELREDQASAAAETIDALYHSILHMVYQVSHKHGRSVKEMLGTGKWFGDASATRSIAHFQQWAARVITAGIEYMQVMRMDSSAIIEKIRQYVQANLKDVMREGIASHVHLNSAYLSRLFKKETGQTLMDYIITVRMNQTKIMLIETDLKISEICESMGYENFSHFSKIFKKQVGVHPQEFRKRYQLLDK